MRFNLILSLLAVSAGLIGSLRAQTPPAPSTAQIGGVPVANLATSTLSTEADTYWVGEVFPLTHRVTGERRVFQSLAGAYDWNPTNLNTDEWSTAIGTTDTPPGGPAAQTFTQTTRAYGRAAGVIELPRGLQPVTLVTGTSTSGGPGILTTDTFTVRTAPARVTLKPLPAPPPMGFAGAVGDFTLKASITTTEVAVGEAVTWTMELAGAGNWPEVRGIPRRAVSKDFDVVTPAARPSLARGTLFDGSLIEDILLVPTKEGTYRLGPIKFTYFDPKVGKYQVLTSETFILKVGGGGAGLGPEPSITDVSATDPNETIPVPDAPPPVPLDPLSNPLASIAPFSDNALGAAVAVPGALFVLFWLSLSTRRSRLTDPLRLQREAHEDMQRLIGQIDAVVGESPDKLKFLLYSWQRAAAQFGGLTITEPTSAQVAAAIEKRRSGVVGSSWAQLWREANRVMYGEKTAIPADWTKRARAALSDAPVPSVPLFAIFLRRNLLPFLGCLALLLALAPVSARADAAADAYQKGEFAAAEAAWRTELAKNPTDAHLRYNLALALAQQDRWTESTAQALSAFVNDPSNPAIRWQFNLSLTRAGIDQPVFAELAAGTGFKQIMRTFSPGGWGVALTCFALLLAASGGFILWSAYSSHSRGLRWLSVLLALVAVAGGVASYQSIQNYGQLADTEIAVVSRHTRLCSIPNDGDTTQKTSPLPAGSLASVTRTFLGWSQVSFTNGQTGWVRTDALTYLYK